MQGDANFATFLFRATIRLMSRARWLGLFLLGLFLVGGGVVLAQTPVSAVGVYYIGPEDAIAQAINLAAPYVVRVDRAELARVLVLNNTPLTSETLGTWGRLVRQEEVGLVVFCGSAFPQNADDLRELLGFSTFGLAQTEAPRALQVGIGDDPLQTAVAWNSAPPLRGSTVISNPNLLLPIVNTTNGDPVLQRVRQREGAQVFLVGAWLADETNPAWARWPYFNYFIYRLVAEAANASKVLFFGDYPSAPVPHGMARWAMAGGALGWVLLAWAAFFFTRRIVFIHPERAARLRLRPVAPAEGPWEQIGFHRPLAGFLFLMGVNLLLFLPVVGYQVGWLPRRLIPWPETLAFWEQVAGWLMVATALFDLGTGTAAVRFFALFRVQSPREAFRYFQFYFWWQLLSGVVQVAGVVWLATLIFPDTAIAHLAFYCIAQVMVRLAGCLRVLGLFFRAEQRFDDEQTLTTVLWVGAVLGQSAAVVVLRRWGAGIADVGAPLGGVFGLGVGALAAELLAFGVGLGLYRRRGYALGALLLPAFDWRIAGQTLWFGARLALGRIGAALALVAQALLLPRWVSDPVAATTAWTVALSATFAFESLATGLYSDLLPALAQAHAYGYQTLIRYYFSQGLRYGLGYGLFVLAALGAVGDRLILGALGPDYATAAHLVGWLLLWGLLQAPAWATDQVFVAIGRPALPSWLTWGELAVRLGLLMVCVPRWQLTGMAVAYLGALLLRVVIAWWLAALWIVPPRLSGWQVGAAVGAALVVYNVLRWVGDWLWRPALGPSLALAGAALLPAVPLYGFFTGLFGGWDEGGLAELQRALPLSGGGWPVAWLLYQGIRLGARISWLHGRFPNALRPYAEEEAQALSARRTVVE